MRLLFLGGACLAVLGGVTLAHHVAGTAAVSAPPLAPRVFVTPAASTPADPLTGPQAQQSPPSTRPGIYPLPQAATPARSGSSSDGVVAFSRDPWTSPSPPSSPAASGPTLFASGGAPPPTTTTEPTTTDPTTTTPAPPPPPPAAPIAVSDVRDVALSSSSATIAWRTSEAVSSRIAYGIDAPTLWTAPEAPTTDHVATLTGLAYGTSYRFAVAAAAPDGRTAWVPFALNTPGLADSTSAATDGGAFLVDGQPYFPTIVWNACSDAYPTQLAAGIDLFMGNGCGTARDQLDRMGNRALSLADARGPAAAGPGLAGSFLPDEWDLHLPGTLSFAEAAGLASTSSPGPRFLTLSNHFYSRANPLPQGRGLYPALVANAEVIGFDLYPLQSWCRYDSFGDVFDAQRELVQLAQGKPTFQWIEARTMDCNDARLAPTPETVRAETWLAIAAGAHGIGYFPNDWSPEIGTEIAREKRELETLMPALTAPALSAQAQGGLVKVGARELNGAIYVIAVNASRSGATDRIVVPELGNRALVSLDGTRSVTPAGGSFTDTFAPLEVHLYVAPPTTT
jgi:Beta-galactosidase